jgi:hypothetical protein
LDLEACTPSPLDIVHGPPSINNLDCRLSQSQPPTASQPSGCRGRIVRVFGSQKCTSALGQIGRQTWPTQRHVQPALSALSRVCSLQSALCTLPTAPQGFTQFPGRLPLHRPAEPCPSPPLSSRAAATTPAPAASLEPRPSMSKATPSILYRTRSLYRTPLVLCAMRAECSSI